MEPSNRHSGWFRINRQLLENDIWLLEPFTRGQAWIDLIGNANFKDSVFNVRGNMISVKRGETAMSEVTMAARWRWSRNKVRRFLKWLENQGNVIQQKNFQTSITVIVNYEQYQSTEQQTEQQKDSRKTADGTHHKNVKKEKNDKNIITTKVVNTPESQEINNQIVISEVINTKNSDIQKRNLDLMTYYESKIGTRLEGSSTDNWRYCTHLFNRMQKQFPDKNNVESIKRIIDIGCGDAFHSKNMNGFKYVFNNYLKIIKSYQENKRTIAFI